jgi:hydrogen peroxide-dependent heme synthase
MKEMTLDEINASARYAGYAVFKIATPLGDGDRAAMAAQVDELFAKLADRDVVVRGTYDISGMRPDADLMIWWHAAKPDDLQDAYNEFRRTELGSHMDPVWVNIGVHRPAEFNTRHVPAFLAGWEPKDYICVYPFVRSYDWYVLEPEARSRILKEHGMAASGYADVWANTLASFALGDYEWLLCFEADDLTRIVDLMRDLRAVEARQHVRLEIPFHTGRRMAVAEMTSIWP